MLGMKNFIIWKYGPLETSKWVEFIGDPVHVGCADGHEGFGVYVWCKVDLEAHCSGQGHVKLVATGEAFDGKYIGTVVMPSNLVWHVVESY